MKKILLGTGLALLTLAACQKNQTAGISYADIPVRVEPVITRATETNFETGDKIGLSIYRAAGAHAVNQVLTYDGTAFSGDLKWYEEGADAATLKAYYPASLAGNGIAEPASFTVETDQSAGTSGSDFLSAVKENVLPSANAVAMVFQHRLSRLVLKVQNNAEYTLDQLVVKGAVPTAVIADDLTATVDETAEAADIKAFADGDTFYAILPAQTVSLSVTLTASGVDMTQKLAEATLLPGKQYTINIIVNPADIQVTLSGEIENWSDGGEIGGYVRVINFEEHLEDGYFLYDDVQYTVAQMKDGKWWMTQNLAFLPTGYETPSASLSEVTAGVFYPLQINETHTAAAFSTDEAVIASNGYLYQAEVALGLKVGDLTSVEAAEALEGTRGICPEGWHVPTISDITGLVGKAVSPIATNTEAPYYNGSNGSIALLNEDGFNMAAFGAISIQDNTKTVGTFMGWASAYSDKLSSGMFCGSTYGGVTYNTAGDATSGVKNLQFYGLMPMTNKATEAEYTCNGTKVSYRIAGPVRCVRD